MVKINKIDIYVWCESIIHLFSILGGSGSRVLESITDGIDFMNHIRNRGLISKDNIIALQCMMWRLNKKGIHDKLLNYARKMDKTLHFYTPTNQPGKYSILHVLAKAFYGIRSIEAKIYIPYWFSELLLYCILKYIYPYIYNINTLSENT